MKNGLWVRNIFRRGAARRPEKSIRVFAVHGDRVI
jgi:hypothetical protein